MTPQRHAQVSGASLAAREPPGTSNGSAEVRSGRARFRVVRELGEGGSSTVYLAEQVEPVARPVALKMLRTAPTHRERMARFEAERQAIALMQHPGIAALYDAGWTAQGRPFFAMEYVPGAPVTDWCRRRGVGTRRALELFLELCAAVAHAHQKGVVHRDLKPSNILVAEEDSRARVKVIDFGLAKSTSVRLHEASFATAHGQLVGTLAYMSPEQLAGDPRQIDVRTDVHALGAVLQEMLTGRPAIDLAGMDLASAIRRVESGRREPPMVGTRRLAADLDLIVGKAMAAEPARRYQSVPELAADVERFLERRPVLARRPGALYVARKFAARNKTATGAIAAAVMIVTTAGASVWAAERKAARSHRVAKETAVFALRDMAVRIADQVGSRPVRREILTKMLGRTEAFARHEGNDPDVQTARAILLGALGDMEEEEGRLDQARPFLDEALRIRRELAARFPEDAARQADLSIALVRAGDCRQQDRAAALEYYEAALRIDEALAAAHPNTPRHLSNLAWSCDRIGELLKAMGRAEDAERMARRQLEVIRRPEAARPWRSDAFRCETSAWIRLARLAQEREDAAAFLRMAERAWASAERGVRVETGSRLAQLMANAAAWTLADARRQAGDLGGALAMAREAVAVMERLSAQDPEDVECFEGYRLACGRARELAAALGDEEEEAFWAAKRDAAPILRPRRGAGSEREVPRWLRPSISTLW